MFQGAKVPCIVGLILCMCAVSAVGDLSYAGDRQEFRAELRAYHHMMPLRTRAHGEVVLSLVEDGHSLRYRVVVEQIAEITMVHLHVGEHGVFSTPVVWLYPPAPPPRLIRGEFSGVLAEGAITAADLKGPLRERSLADLIEEIRAGKVWANLHTRGHPDVEFRGPVK